jgi:hypothetical protein
MSDFASQVPHIAGALPSATGSDTSRSARAGQLARFVITLYNVRSIGCARALPLPARLTGVAADERQGNRYVWGTGPGFLR